MKYILGLVCLGLFAAQSWVQNGNIELYVGEGNNHCCKKSEFRSCIDQPVADDYICPSTRPDPCTDPTCNEYDHRGYCADANCVCKNGSNCEPRQSIPPWNPDPTPPTGVYTASDSCYETGDNSSEPCFEEEWFDPPPHIDPPVLIASACFYKCNVMIDEWDGTQPSWVTQSYYVCNADDTDICPPFWTQEGGCPGGVSSNVNSPCIESY
ncbi:MAG: hypothetical protein DWQ19_10395 [Crenarchaeota archaeon]|nr:MAG: hypothetical protein DWQ19_10395 [Thermoproteota archaeon]